MIDAARRSGGYPISPRATPGTKVGRTAEGPQNDAVTDAVNGALQSQSNNPILRAFRGESGFDDVKGVSGPSRAGGQGVSRAAQAGLQGVNGASQAGLERASRPSELDGLQRQSGSEHNAMIEYLKGMISALRTALRKDPVPPSYKAPQGETPSVGSAGATGTGASPTPAGAPQVSPPSDPEEGPKSTQNLVTDNPLPDIDPLEKVLQLLEGILQALQQTKPSQGAKGGQQG